MNPGVMYLVSYITVSYDCADIESQHPAPLRLPLATSLLVSNPLSFQVSTEQWVFLIVELLQPCN